MPVPQLPVRSRLQDGRGYLSVQWLRALQEALGPQPLQLTSTHADRMLTGPVLHPAANYAPGTLLYETDRTVYYASIELRDGAGALTGAEWQYWGGTMTGTTAQRPADLTTADAGFRYSDTDKLIAQVWSGSAWSNETTPTVESTGTVRSTGGTAGANLAGQGVEMVLGAGGIGFVLAYDRTGAAYLELRIQGDPIVLGAGHVLVNTLTDDGVNRVQINGDLTVAAGSSYKVDGTQVVGGQGAAVPDVVYTVNAGAASWNVGKENLLNALLASHNALLAELRAATGHGLIA